MSQQTIREILSHTCLSKAGCKDCQFKNDLCDDCFKEAHTAILKLIKEMVPEEEVLAYDTEFEHGDIVGYNACRKEILDRLEEMEACRK